MSVMIAELYDALRDAGASEEKARAAAKAVSDNESRLDKLDARMGGLEGRFAGIQSQIDGMKAQIEALRMRMDTMTWVLGFNAAMTVAILVRTFFG